MSGPPKCKVFFRWSCDDVQPQEEVCVTGNCDELGNWQPTSGVTLHRDSTRPGCFTSSGVPMPIGRRVEYKYVIRNVNSMAEKWQEDKENKWLLATGRRYVKEDDGGKYRDVPVTAMTMQSGGAANRGNTLGLEEQQNTIPRLQSFEQKVTQEEETQVDPRDRIYAVFRTLPVTLRRSDSGDWEAEADRNSGFVNFKVVSMLARSVPKHLLGATWFVGHPGVFTSDPEEQRKITEALAPHNCIPVFIDEQDFRGTLEFCHLFLWPVMHNMKVFDDDAVVVDQGQSHQKFDETQWKTYQAFNKRYADAIDAQIGKGAAQAKVIVWIHDFYLLLVPKALRHRRSAATIGFYLHSAFPSSEVFRCIPPREEILLSMLSCAVVTFQIFEYARHFLSCCQFLLNATHHFEGAGNLLIEHDSESVVIRADHFAIPYQDLADLVKDNKNIAKEADAIRQAFGGSMPLRQENGGKLLFASIDGDEPFSGLMLKLRVFQKFLSECPQHTNRVCLFQHVLGKRVAGEKESELVAELKRLVETINKDFGQGGQPAVVVRFGDVTVTDRLSILQAADVLLDTSINDGLNVHPFLFTAAHALDGKGSMILSEFSGCSSVLIGARKVNPWNLQATMDCMHATVTQDADERERKFKQDLFYVSRLKLSSWVQSNLSDLKRAGLHKASAPVTGLGAGGTLFFMERGFRHLPAESVIRHYSQAKNRAILLDNEGTLAPDRRTAIKPYGAQEKLDRSGQPPDPDVKECLQALANDRNNTVMVISGRPSSVLDTWFGDVKDLGLCAEHGFYWVPPGRGTSSAGSNRWNCTKETCNEDEDWKQIAEQLMQQYVKRVQGSVLEFKGCSVAWNYRKVGAQQLANEIALELARFLDPSSGPDSLLHGYPVVVVNGKGYVEVKRSDVDKGVAVNRVLNDMRERLGQVDFVLCIGDDRSDEDMFHVVNNLSAGRDGVSSCLDDDSLSAVPTLAPVLESSPKTAKSSGMWSSGGAATRMSRKASVTLEDHSPLEENNKHFTVTVGRKPTKAGYFLKDVQEVTELLQKLAQKAKAQSLARFSSMPMLARSDDDSD